MHESHCTSLCLNRYSPRIAEIGTGMGATTLQHRQCIKSTEVFMVFDLMEVAQWPRNIPHDNFVPGRTTYDLNTTDASPIARIEPTESYRTLRVWISPSGHNNGAREVLGQIATDFNVSIGTSHLD
jgi:hypothetical protein